MLRSSFALTASNGVSVFARQAPRGFFARLFSQRDKLMSDIRFHCVICGNGLKIPSELSDGLMECSTCSRVVPVPLPFTRPHQEAGCLPALPRDILALEIKILCATCDTRIRLDARWEGRTVTCPVCSTEIRVPEWSRPPRTTARPAVLPLSTEEIEFLSAPVALAGPAA